MKRVRRIVVFLLVAGVIAVLMSVAPSPLPPSGPIGASRIVTPPERIAIVDATTGWLAAGSGGRAVEMYNETWLGGGSGSRMMSKAMYSGFKGVIFVARWPFMLPYGGSVADSPEGGYVVQAKVDGLAPSTISPEAVPQADQDRTRAMVDPLIAAAGIRDRYGAGQVAGWTTFTRDTSGTLVAQAALPSSALGAKPGAVQIGLSRDFAPLYARVITPADYPRGAR